MSNAFYERQKFNMFHLKSIVLMLEYCKTILTKVSFDRGLFEKELKKSLQFVDKSERDKLINWCKRTFGLSDEMIFN